MINKTVETAINRHINAEIYSAYLYYAMAFWFDRLSLTGCAHWMRVQALEELTHAQKFTAFINERGGTVSMTAVDAPPSEWESPLHCFEEVYRHECKVTGLINDLMDTAMTERDHATASFLKWFIDEQIEEEATADDTVQKLKLISGDNSGLFLLDRELDTRSFTMPPDLAGVF